MLDKPHVLVADDIDARGVDILQSNPEVKVTVDAGLSAQALRAQLPSYQGLIVRSATKVTAEVLETATDLRIIGRAGIGVDNIDVEAATRRGIVVMNTPEGNTNTAAEHTVSMLLALSRYIPQASASLKSGQWRRADFLGVEVMDLKSLLACSDFVTVHTPMTADTRHLIGYDALQVARQNVNSMTAAPPTMLA